MKTCILLDEAWFALVGTWTAKVTDDSNTEIPVQFMKLLLHDHRVQWVQTKLQRSSFFEETNSELC
jgi:hypothetical protein